MNEFVAEEINSFVKSKVWFRAMADYSPLGMFMTDSDGNCLYSNDAAEKITGMSAEQLRGKGWIKSIHPADRERVMVEHERARHRGIPFSCTYRFLHGGGKVVWGNVKMGEVREGEDLLGYVGTMDDITERIQAEQEFRESEEKWRSLTENTPDIIVTTLPDGQIVSINRIVVPGLSTKDVIGSSIYQYIAPRSVAMVRSIVERVVSTGQADFYETMGHGAHGMFTWWETRVVPIRRGGRVVNLMLISWDATKRKLVEEETHLLAAVGRIISEAEDMHSVLSAVLRKVCETTGWALGQTWNVRADEAFLECGPAWYASNDRLHAFRKQSEKFTFKKGGLGLPGRAWDTRMPVWIPDLQLNSKSPLALFACEAGIHASVAIPVIAGNQVVAVIEFFRLEPYREDESFIKLVSAVAVQLGMVFQRKQAQEMLRGSHEQLRALSTHLQSVREQERTFIAREIHDELGQALTGLKMDVSWIETKIIPPNSSGQRPFLLKRLRTMAKLIDSLVQSVRRIATELRPGVLDELGLVAAIEWQSEEFHKRSGIRCRIKMPDEDLRVDQETTTAIFRIFQEILTNVARHANATALDILLAEKEDAIILEVHDNGRGITTEQITDSKSLGLLGMRERVLLLNGSVQFNGTLDKGTTVTVRVPMDVLKTDRLTNRS